MTVTTRKCEWGEIRFTKTDTIHRYDLFGSEVTNGRVPGASTVAKIVGDGIPPWWGMKVGVQGICALADRGIGDDVQTTDEFIELLKEHKLTVNDVRDTAGFRGTAVHRFIAQDPRPDIEEFAPEERPYIRSFLLWEEDAQPTYLAFEQMVAHPLYNFAGTYDARVKLGDRECIVDWKTSKRVYTEMHYQLAGYELAASACGENKTDAQYVIRLDKDGGFPEVVKCEAIAEDFITALDLYASRKAVEKRIRAGKREKTAA